MLSTKTLGEFEGEVVGVAVGTISLMPVQRLELVNVFGAQPPVVGLAL
jgi:hypothetical protein